MKVEYSERKAELGDDGGRLSADLKYRIVDFGC
jgi:hypothetical protein